MQNFLPMLAVLFIGLKLTNYLTWSWWVILSPLWIPFGILLVALLVLIVGAIYEDMQPGIRRKK